MADILQSPGYRGNWTESKEEAHDRRLNEHMVGKIIDDDLPFNPFTDIESLVSLKRGFLGGQYECFARLSNGVVISLDESEFHQCHLLLFGGGVAHVTGLSLDGCNGANLWIVDNDLRKQIQAKHFSWECPVWKMWRRMDALKSAVVA